MKHEPVKRPLNERLPLACPVCGRRADYVRWEGGTHFYRCQRHGAILLSPDGTVRPDDPQNSEVLH